MSYFSHAFRKTFIPGDVQTASGQSPIQMTSQKLGLFSPTTNASLATGGLNAHNANVPDLFYFAQGSFYGSDTVGNNPAMGGYQETIKSKILNPKYVNFIGKMDSQAAVNDAITLTAQYNCFPCGSLGMVRVDLKGSPALRFMSHNMYKVFSANNLCCTTGESYQDPTWVLANIADEINDDTFWSQFITATLKTSTDGGATFSAVTASASSFVTGYNSGSALSTVTSSNQGQLILTAAFTSTTFGNCSFDPRDYHEMEPIIITNADVLDETGDVCVTCGTFAHTANGAQLIGSGETVLRDLILSESYRQHHFPVGTRNASRMREIEQGDDLFTYVDRTQNDWNSYYIQHSVPRFNNPSGTFDNDQYMIRVAARDGVGADGDLVTLFGTNLPAWAGIGYTDLNSVDSAL
tara:strand:- start:7942 stop:9165 length:1224 start_codon:yes stop_codon:yes gene_type:complete